MKTYGVIMAGGGGTRFWPLSTKAEPKQFLNLSGKDILVNETIDRQHDLMDQKDIFIVTNETQAKMMKERTAGRIAADHILAEPAARNTAACIGYAAMEILHKYGDGVMCIFAADAYIRDEAEYTRVMKEAVRAVEETDALVTIGIHPTFPSTGYGYIRSVEEAGKVWRKVEEFVEKPDLETAKSYLASGSYAWNSGMFVWKASTILHYFEELLPDVSVDYGIMERAKGVLMLEGDFGWNDVGSWDTLDAVRTRDAAGNISSGDTLLLDAKNCVVYGGKKLIAAVGVENLVIVEGRDSILVCPVDQAQRVKEVVETLEKEGRTERL